VLRLLERRFGVSADISSWRRAVCGDLTGAFDFSSADERPFVASLPSAVESASRAAALPDRTTPPSPVTLEAPAQDTGVRRSRPLPYRPEAVLTVDPAARQVRLALACEGAAAVLHVYDRLRPDAIPRRYTVAPGQPLAGSWNASDGRYDLWLLGPNGFHRHFSGRIDALPVGAALVPGAQDPLQAQLRLRNPRATAETLRLSAGAYPETMPGTRLRLAPGEARDIELPLAASSGWYDLWISTAGSVQRLAGRVETGRDSFSDPAMGGPAPLWQEEARS
jgi:phospholipase C